MHDNYFSISETQTNKDNLKYITIENSDKTCFAKISLDLGGSLESLMLNNKTLIENLHPLKYKDTFASSILFPFANRIKNGTYLFQDKPYQLEINQKDENNALHGLVYNKYFEVIEKTTTKSSASVTLLYKEINQTQGFPYTFNIKLQYTLSNKGLSLKINIVNTDEKPFPFTIGWHPYFICSDLYNSFLEFDCDKSILFDSKNITTGIKDSKIELPFEIKDKRLDDCFILNSNRIAFKCSDYSLLISSSSSNNNFLQIYTPDRANTIAIEPTTGVSDSFNNGIGLSVLKPNDSYEIEWVLSLERKDLI